MSFHQILLDITRKINKKIGIDKYSIIYYDSPCLWQQNIEANFNHFLSEDGKLDHNFFDEISKLVSQLRNNPLLFEDDCEGICADHDNFFTGFL